MDRLFVLHPWREGMAQMPDPGLLEQIGIRIQPAFAGMMGGIVGAWADGKAGLVAWCSYVGSGLITANYLAEPSIHVMPFSVSEGVAGFIVGLGALVIVRTLIGFIKRWHPQFSNNDGGK
jgi:hypothetical protein